MFLRLGHHLLNFNGLTVCTFSASRNQGKRMFSEINEMASQWQGDLIKSLEVALVVVVAAVVMCDRVLACAVVAEHD